MSARFYNENTARLPEILRRFTTIQDFFLLLGSCWKYLQNFFQQMFERTPADNIYVHQNVEKKMKILMKTYFPI